MGAVAALLHTECGTHYPSQVLVTLPPPGGMWIDLALHRSEATVLETPTCLSTVHTYIHIHTHQKIYFSVCSSLTQSAEIVSLSLYVSACPGS